MALMTMGDVIGRVQALLDDPAGRRFTSDYIRPYVDQENEEIQVFLERLGVQQEEQQAIFNVPAQVGGSDGSTPPCDLTPYFAPGQPLQYLQRPTKVEWKVQGMPDVAYVPSDPVSSLDDVTIGNVGCQQYKWSGGAIYTTPSYTAVTFRITFLALTQTIYDSAAQVMRGTGNILALQVAAFIAALNNNMGKLQAKLDKNLSRNKQNLTNLLVMQQQSQLKVPRGTKRGRAVQISAGGNSFM